MRRVAKRALFQMHVARGGPLFSLQSRVPTLAPRSCSACPLGTGHWARWHSNALCRSVGIAQDDHDSGRWVFSVRSSQSIPVTEDEILFHLSVHVQPSRTLSHPFLTKTTFPPSYHRFDCSLPSTIRVLVPVKVPSSYYIVFCLFSQTLSFLQRSIPPRLAGPLAKSSSPLHT